MDGSIRSHPLTQSVLLFNFPVPCLSRLVSIPVFLCLRIPPVLLLPPVSGPISVSRGGVTVTAVGPSRTRNQQPGRCQLSAQRDQTRRCRACRRDEICGADTAMVARHAVRRPRGQVLTPPVISVTCLAISGFGEEGRSWRGGCGKQCHDLVTPI